MTELHHREYSEYDLHDEELFLYVHAFSALPIDPREILLTALLLPRKHEDVCGSFCRQCFEQPHQNQNIRTLQLCGSEKQFAEVSLPTLLLVKTCLCSQLHQKLRMPLQSCKELHWQKFGLYPTDSLPSDVANEPSRFLNFQLVLCFS